MADFAFGRLRPILDLGEQRRLYAAMCNLLGVGAAFCGSAALGEPAILGRRIIKAVIDLTGVDQLIALLPFPAADRSDRFSFHFGHLDEEAHRLRTGGLFSLRFNSLDRPFLRMAGHPGPPERLLADPVAAFEHPAMTSPCLRP